MTPKEKAKELVDKFLPYTDTYHNGSFENARQCALIAINQILDICPIPNRDYYEKVKQEIEKL